MVCISTFLAFAVVTSSIHGSFTLAHPGEYHDSQLISREMEVRALISNQQARSLSSCQNSLEVQARNERTIKRRVATVQRLREERGLTEEPFLHRRDLAQFESWENVNHAETGALQFNSSTPESVVFGANTTCILTPDNANGPYYVLGEHIRSNVVESEPGVPMHLEMQFIDIETCKPVTDLLIDIWSCNATGHYSGFSAAGESSLDSTFLRGVQATDMDGVVTFDTIFPGHYAGRATHEHVISHTGATVQPIGTYTGGAVSNLSQLFFDQSLINAIEATSQYNINTIPQTTYDADFFTGYSATAAYDPFPEYIMLGSALSSGLYVWIEMGINMTADWTTNATNAAYLVADGGHDNPEFNEWIVATPPSDAG